MNISQWVVSFGKVFPSVFFLQTPMFSLIGIGYSQGKIHLNGTIITVVKVFLFSPKSLHFLNKKKYILTVMDIEGDSIHKEKRRSETRRPYNCKWCWISESKFSEMKMFPWSAGFKVIL